MMFAKAERALEPLSQTAKKAAWLYAAILTIMVVAQLFAFENLVPLFQDMAFPGGDGTGSLLICLIAFAEIFALPFLLRMPLSPLMRWFSLGCSIFVPLAWLAVTVWLFTVQSSVLTILMNGGILGTKVHVAAVYQLVVALVLLAGSLYTAYGLWPVRKN